MELVSKPVKETLLRLTRINRHPSAEEIKRRKFVLATYIIWFNARLGVSEFFKPFFWIAEKLIGLVLWATIREYTRRRNIYFNTRAWFTKRNECILGYYHRDREKEQLAKIDVLERRLEKFARTFEIELDTWVTPIQLNDRCYAKVREQCLLQRAHSSWYGLGEEYDENVRDLCTQLIDWNLIPVDSEFTDWRKVVVKVNPEVKPLRLLLTYFYCKADGKPLPEAPAKTTEETETAPAN